MIRKLPLYMLVLAAVAILGGCSSDDDDDDDDKTTTVVAPDARVVLGLLGRYNTGLFDDAGAEIPAFDPLTDRVFVVNAGPGTVDVIDLSDPENPTLIQSIDVSVYGGGANPEGAPNSVAVHNGILAIAVEQGDSTSTTDAKQQPGEVVFFNTNDATLFATPLNVITAGALPDMVTFTPDGNYVLVANEGEPNDDYTVDPEGSITIIDISGGVAGATVATASCIAASRSRGCRSSCRCPASTLA